MSQFLVLQAIAALGGEATASEITEWIRVNRPGAARSSVPTGLQRLEKRGEVRKVGMGGLSGRANIWRVDQ